MPPRRKGLFAVVFADRLRGLAPTVVIAQVMMGVVTSGWVASWPDRRFGPRIEWKDIIDRILNEVPVQALGFSVRLPWQLPIVGYLFWPLALPVSLWIVFSGRSMGGRALAAAVALAAAATTGVVAMAVTGRRAPAAAVSSFEIWQAFLLLAVIAAGVVVLLLPLRRVARAPAVGPTGFGGLMVWALLTTQLMVFTAPIGRELGEFLSPDAIPDLHGRYSDLAIATADAMRWPVTLLSLATLLVPAILVLRGGGLLDALRALVRAARRRPSGLIAATWHAVLLGAMLLVFLNVLWRLGSMEEDRITATYKAVLYSAVGGLLLGYWIWLMGRFALALTDPGYLGLATQVISPPPSASGVPSKSP